MEISCVLNVLSNLFMCSVLRKEEPNLSILFKKWQKANGHVEPFLEG